MIIRINKKSKAHILLGEEYHFQNYFNPNIVNAINIATTHLNAFTIGSWIGSSIKASNLEEPNQSQQEPSQLNDPTFDGTTKSSRASEQKLQEFRKYEVPNFSPAPFTGAPYPQMM